MDKTVRALEDLSVDDQLGRRRALTDGFVRALEKRRAALRDAIPEAFLAAYDALGRVGRRPAVVRSAARTAAAAICASRRSWTPRSAAANRCAPAPTVGRLLYSVGWTEDCRRRKRIGAPTGESDSRGESRDDDARAPAFPGDEREKETAEGLGRGVFPRAGRHLFRYWSRNRRIAL